MQARTVKPMAWLLTGALLALTVACGGENLGEVGAGISPQVVAPPTAAPIPQVVSTPLVAPTAQAVVRSTEMPTGLVVSTPSVSPTVQMVSMSTVAAIPQVVVKPTETPTRRVAVPPTATADLQVSPTLGEDWGVRKLQCPLKDSSSMKEEIVSTRRPTSEEVAVAVERARSVRHKYEDLFSRQPNVWGVGIGRVKYPDGQVSEEIGFVVSVTEKVDQNTLSPEDRIPDCLEGVPVFIVEEPVPVLTPEAPEKPKEERENGGR